MNNETIEFTTCSEEEKKGSLVTELPSFIPAAPDTIVFDTAKATQVVQPKIAYFNLVSEKDPVLLERLPEFDFANPPVDPNEFASSLVETCRVNRGIGLSANQCGFKYRVFVMGAYDDYVAFYNPRILEKADEDVHLLEGCLSYPLLGLRITRPKSVVVEYQDFNGVLHETRLDGLSARCFQHELDHMNGITFMERTKPLALQMGLKKRTKAIKKMSMNHFIQKAA